MLTKKENIKNDVKNHKNTKNTSSSQETHTHENHNGCCQPPKKTPNQQPAKTYSQQQTPKPESPQADKKGSSKTRITIKYDAGFPNQLYIRGKGANLSWDKGQLLKNVKIDEWVWETDAHFTHCEFKILINDRVYENGDNHLLNAGSTLLYTPHFY
jgi:hypothetical protein